MTRQEAIRWMQRNGYSNVNEVPYNDLPEVLRPMATPGGAPEGMPRPQPRAEQSPPQGTTPTDAAPTQPRQRPDQTGTPMPEPEVEARQPAASEAVSNFLTGAMEALPAAAYTALDAAGTGVDMPIIQAERGARTGGEAFSIATADRGTGGLLDFLAGGREQALGLAAGQDPAEAAAAGAEASDQVDRNIELARENYRIQTLGGDIAGVLANGGGYLRFANSVVRPSTFRGLGGGSRGGTITDYIVAPAVAGSAEATVYGLNSDFSLDRIGTDAAQGAAFGAIGGAVFGTIAGGVRGLRGSTARDIEIDIGEQLFRSIQRSEAARGNDITLQQAVDMVNQRGADQLLSDLYPDLVPQLRTIASSSDPRVQRRAVELLRTRSQMDSHRDQILNVIRGDNPPRSRESFNTALDEQRRQLGPEYDRVFADMDAVNWSVPRSTVVDTLTRGMNDNYPTHSDDVRIVRQAIREVAGDADTLSYRQLNDVRKNIQEQVFQRIRRNNSGANSEVMPIGNIQSANQLIGTYLGRHNPRFAELQATYGDIAEARNAYNFGSQIISSRFYDKADAQMFMNSNISPRVAEAFTEGARYNLYSTARNAANPATALREARLEDLSGIVGDDITQEMVARVEEIAAASRGTEALTSPGAAPRDPSVSPASRAADAMMGIRAARGGGGGLLPILAARRFLQGATGADAAAPTTGMYRAESAALADAFLTSGRGQPARVDAPRGPEDLLAAARDQANTGAVPRAATAVGGVTATQGGTESSEQMQDLTEYGMSELRDFVRRFSQ